MCKLFNEFHNGEAVLVWKNKKMLFIQVNLIKKYTFTTKLNNFNYAFYFKVISKLFKKPKEVKIKKYS